LIERNDKQMEQLNNDCLIYTCQYLSFQDKINFIKTCKQFYNIGQDIFKNCVVKYNVNNTRPDEV